MVFSGIYPVVGLLGHMVVLFLVFKGTSIVFSIVAVSIYIPTNISILDALGWVEVRVKSDARVGLPCTLKATFFF